jgi:hypothetical protein
MLHQNLRFQIEAHIAQGLVTDRVYVSVSMALRELDIAALV